MEKIEEYRHIITKEVKEIFLESFKSAIEKIDKKKFSFIGVIGSIKKDKSHDIDVVILPSKNTKLGEAMIELAKIYELTEQNIKKHHERYYIVTCPKLAMQEMVYYLAGTEEGAAGMIPVHSMFYANYNDLKRLSPKSFIKRMKENLITLHGSLKEAKSLPQLPQEKLEPYFFLLDFEMSSRIKNFPRHLIRASAESLFDYLKKKYQMKINEKIPHNIEEINKEFIKLLKILDKQTYST